MYHMKQIKQYDYKLNNMNRNETTIISVIIRHQARQTRKKLGGGGCRGVAKI